VGKRSVELVANLTRRDGEELLELTPNIPVETKVITYPLAQANQALEDLRKGNFDCSPVLQI